MNTSVIDLTRDHVYAIYPNLREMDKKELENLNVTNAEEAANRIFGQCSFANCGMVDDIPTAMYGAMKEEDHVTVFFIATSRINDIPITFQRHAKQFIQDVRNTYPNYPLVAIVLNGYDASVKWLSRLGFKKSLNIQGNTIMRLN